MVAVPINDENIELLISFFSARQYQQLLRGDCSILVIMYVSFVVVFPELRPLGSTTLRTFGSINGLNGFGNVMLIFKFFTAR